MLSQPLSQLSTSVPFDCHMPLHFMNGEIIATNAVYKIITIVSIH